MLPPNTCGRSPPNPLGSSNPSNMPTRVIAARDVAQPSIMSRIRTAILRPLSCRAASFTRSEAPQKARLDEPIVKPRWNLIRVLTLVFTVLSIISLVYISVASANYLSFYPSLGDIKQQISSVVYQRDPVGNQMS